MENEDEESLEAVEDGKYVGHGDGVLVYIQDTEHPGQAQENHQDCCPFHPGPATDPNLSGTLLIICFMFRTAFYLCQLWGRHSVIGFSVHIDQGERLLCHLRDLSCCAGLIFSHWSAVTGPRVRVPPRKNRVLQVRNDKSPQKNKKEAQRTSLLFHREYSNKIEVLASCHINERYSVGLTEFHCCTLTSPWTERECWHVCALCTQPCPAW